MRRINFDHYRTTPIDKDVLNAMKPYFEDKFHLPQSFTSTGTEIAETIENAENRILKNFGLKYGNVIFTNGGTMANNMIIHGLLRDAEPSESEIITSQISHPSILRVHEYYAKRGFRTRTINVDEKGYIDIEQLKRSLNNKTKLVSITYVNHTIGTIQDVAKISATIKEYNDNIKILVDGALAVNSIKINLEELNIDFLTLSGHKIYGPKGTGAIVSKSLKNLKPIIFGTVNTSPFTPGAENIPGIVGLSFAVEKAVKNSQKYREKITKLRNYMMGEIEKNISDVILNGPKVERAVDNVNYSFRFVEGESIMMFLDFENIIIATGSACASSDLKVNYILSAIGRNHELAHGSLRITLGRENTKEEVDIFINKLKEIVERLRKQSTIRR